MEDRLGQREALERARGAAAGGDPRGMLEALGASRILDGLVERIGGKWRRLDREDCYEAVAQAVDSLYATVLRGGKVHSVAGYLFKAADRCAFDLDATKRQVVATDPGILEGMGTGGEASPLDQLEAPEPSPVKDRADRRAEGIARLRSLVPRCGGPNIQAVLTYLLDAMEIGREHVPNEDLEEVTGLSPQTVRTSRSRGLARLEAHAREAALGAAELAELGPADDADDEQEDSNPQAP